MLRDEAMTWYLEHFTATKTDWTLLQAAFKERYFPQEINRWIQTSQIWSMKQGKDQSEANFMFAAEVEPGRAEITEDQLRCVVAQGLLPYIRQLVVTREGTDVNSLSLRQCERQVTVTVTCGCDTVAGGAQGTVHGTFEITLSFTRRVRSQSVSIRR